MYKDEWKRDRISVNPSSDSKSCYVVEDTTVEEIWNLLEGERGVTALVNIIRK